MYRKYVVAGALIVAFAAPAFAAEFYVAQNAADKKCPLSRLSLTEGRR